MPSRHTGPATGEDMLLLLLLPLPLLLLLAGGADGHGRLIEPPSRSSMWRYGFKTPPDYNDHELYCGGFSRQWQRNKGRCGICGDPWDTPQPRLHEAGGVYATGTLVRKYLTGSAITIRIELTANHRGYFEFRLCPVNDFQRDATQECLDRHVLQRAPRNSAAEDAESESHETRYYPGPGNKVFPSRYRLPAGLTCTHCVLQWRYIAGNNWGMCPNGTGAVGCGPQEEFRACADVAVVDSAGEADGTPLAPSDEGEDLPIDGTPAPKPRGDSGSGLLVLLIALCALAGSATVLSLMYLYFYHAGDRVKSWLAARRRDVKGGAPSAVSAMPPGPPAPPPRHKRPSSMGATIIC